MWFWQDIWYELNDLQKVASRLRGMAECLDKSPRPDVGKNQLEQIVKAEDEIKSLQLTCKNLIESLGGNTDDIDSQFAVSCSSLPYRYM